jgi:hypothetical protein
MSAPVWGVLLIAFALGLVAAWISQFTAARKGLEANAKTKTLRENVNGLIERNAVRRENLKRRQEILDKYVMMDIEHQKGQLDDQALRDAIAEERKRIADLRKAIADSENIIVENRRILAEVERKRALNSGWLLFISGGVGGATALIFGFIGYLGSAQPITSITQSVGLTTSLVVQSLALGAGWPLAWEKVFAIDKLESTASTAAMIFQNTIKEVEKEEV